MLQADGMPVHRVTTSEELRSLCEQWRNEPVLALDTEFVRTNTFYARLGLIQIADDRACYLIDPLGIGDWNCLTGLLRQGSPKIVLHSASEDLNLLLTSFGYIPAPIFDTQIAAGFSGMGFSLSYQALVGNVLEIEVAKGETRSDWLQRPLTESQQRYAALDVRYLLDLQRALEARLVEQGKLAWFEEECALRVEEAATLEQPESWVHQYAGVSNAWRLNDRELSYLQRLCFWREQEARRRNRPKAWIAKDNELLAIARVFSENGTPPAVDALYRLREVNRKLIKYNGEAMLAALQTNESLPSPDRSRLAAPLQPRQRKLLRRCQQQVQQLGEQLHMAPELLAKKRQLVDLLKGLDQGAGPDWNGVLSGWRRTILEPALKKVFDGAP